MSAWIRCWVFCAAWIAATGAVLAADYTLETAASPPDGFPEGITAVVAPGAMKITGPERPYCELRLVKSLSVPKEFQSTAAVRYPFTPGELVGVLTVPRRSGLTDFRGNSIERGAYTLRYGRQPMDGNHIGTSDLADFLVAIPADKDESPEPITDLARLYELSAGASGTAHPAIFSLQPAEAPSKEPTLTHDENREFWILQFNASVQRDGKAAELPVRMVIVGVTEG